MSVKYENKYFVDKEHNGNYTEEIEYRFTAKVPKRKAKEFFKFWNAIGCVYYETPEAYYYEKNIDSTHFTQYIIYK